MRLIDYTLHSLENTADPSAVRTLYEALAALGVNVGAPLWAADLPGVRRHTEPLLYEVDAALFCNDQDAFLETQKNGQVLCARGEPSLAAALTVDWLLTSGEGACVSLLGAGGYAPLETVVMALYVSGHANWDLLALKSAAEAWEQATGRSIPKHQPVLGGAIFEVASGVHVDGLMKHAKSYEPFSPQMLGAKRQIVLNAQSGKSAVIFRLNELEISCADVDIEQLVSDVKRMGMEGRLTQREFEVLVEGARKGRPA